MGFLTGASMLLRYGDGMSLDPATRAPG
jgi:hypothetical protein